MHSLQQKLTWFINASKCRFRIRLVLLRTYPNSKTWWNHLENIITSPRLSWFTLNVSKQTMGDIEDWRVSINAFSIIYRFYLLLVIEILRQEVFPNDTSFQTWMGFSFITLHNWKVDRFNNKRLPSWLCWEKTAKAATTLATSATLATTTTTTTINHHSSIESVFLGVLKEDLFLFSSNNFSEFFKFSSMLSLLY